MIQERCVHLECDRVADFSIHWAPDGESFACDGHLGEVIGHDPETPAPDFYAVRVIEAPI